MKKARLDLLEEMPDIELAAPDVQPLEEEVEEVPVERGRTWAFNKLILIGAPVALVVLIISGILGYFLLTRTTSPSQQTVVTQKAPAPVREHAVKSPPPAEVKKTFAVSEITRTIYVKDFMIDLKDNQGNNRILICDVAFDVAADSGLEKLEESVDLRNIIYRTAQNRSAVAMKSIEERKKLKKDLADQLDKLAGKAVVKKVYFVNYFIM